MEDRLSQSGAEKDKERLILTGRHRRSHSKAPCGSWSSLPCTVHTAWRLLLPLGHSWLRRMCSPLQKQKHCEEIRNVTSLRLYILRKFNKKIFNLFGLLGCFHPKCFKLHFYANMMIRFKCIEKNIFLTPVQF